jgi:nucleoside-diphosphate-sugar epimerase
MSTTLVTGGTGFIGAYVARELLDHGHEVVCYDRSTDTTTLEKVGVAGDVTVRRGDVSDPVDVIHAVRETGADRVVHLAALLTDTARENPRAAIEVNVQGTNAVFEAARAADLERVAWASSAAVYAPPEHYPSRDDTRLHGPVTEADLVYPDTLYGATKEYNEHQARVYSEDYPLSLVGLRPTVAYGPYRETGGSAFLANIVEKPALGEPFAVDYGDQVVDWQHVEDIARAFRLAVEVDAAELSREVYNVAGVSATVREAVETVRELVPDADLTVSDEGELPWTQRLDDTAARRDMGYEPAYDLTTGFRQYADRLRAEHGLDPL